MKIFSIVVVLCYCIVSYSQGTEEWVARYNGAASGYDIAYDIAVDADGNVYVTGSSQGIGTGQDYFTIKYNADGIEQWSARYDGPISHHDQAYSLAVDNSGNVYVTGGSFGNGTERDFLTIKYNSNGDIVWTRRYNGPGFDLDEAVAIVLDDLADVYITGYSDSGDNLDYFTIKYDSAGNQIWSSRYIGNGNISENRPHDIAIDNKGFVYVTGESSSSLSSPNLDSYATIKYNQSGDSVWIARYKGPGIEGLSQAYALAIDSSGNVYVTGRSDPFSAFGFNFDMVTIKYNSDGDSLWVHRYDGPGNSSDGGNDVAVDSDGNIIVTGFSVDITSADFFTIKYNTNGDTLWTARYNGMSGPSSASSVALDSEDNIYVSGFSGGNGTSRDYATIKYSPDGVEQWVMRYNGPGNGDDEIKAMVIDDLGNVYVTGNSFGNGMDYATIKYSSGVTANEIEESIVKEYLLEQNYPNPFNPSTTIRYSIPEAGNVKLSVYNLLGEQVAQLVDEFKEAGMHAISFNAANLNSGMYIYKLEMDGSVQSRKMILLK